MAIDYYSKVGYNVTMVYVKSAEGQKKLRDEFVRKNQDKLCEYELIGEYINKDTKTLFRHKACGSEFLMTPGNFRSGHKCPVCARRQRATAIKKAKGNKFLDIIKNSGGEYILKSEYQNYRTPVSVFHQKCGRVFSRVPNSINNKSFSGELCTLCSRNNDAQNKTYSLEKANKRLEKINPEYRFVTYSGASHKALVKHLVCGQTFEGKASYFVVGGGHCPNCTTNISKEEREIYEWIKALVPDTVRGDRSVLGGKELDIYVPSKKVAIEYNGHYWHSAQKLVDKMTYAEAKQFHYKKSLECERAGIRLIHIWDYEWADEQKRKVLENIILGALGMLPERHYARDTICRHYARGCDRWEELGRFFAKNNIQGNRGGSDAFTLEDKTGRILMAYKFGRPSGGKAKKLYQYEMVRGASAYGAQVVGGASKLWSHFVKEMNPESVVYYIDYNYFDGRSVKKLGGEFVCSQPGVKNYWVKEKQIKNREPRRHKEVKQAINEGRVLELWNAGTKTFVFRFNR